MAQKRLNKNLVAFLTVMGILLTVIVVAIATSQAGRKPPQFWAEKAEQQRQAGDYEQAIRYYDQAYRVSKGPRGVGRDVSYLVRASDCALRYGDIALALGTLERARADQPDEPVVQAAYLGIVWDVFQPEWGLNPDMRTAVLEHAEALERMDPSGVLGPISVAVARWAMVDPTTAQAEDWTVGDEAFARAAKLQENDARVVRARIQMERRRTVERLMALDKAGGSRAEYDAAEQQFRDKRLEILKVGVEANPGDWRLITEYVDALDPQVRTTEAGPVLERALAGRESDPDLQLALARYLWQQAFRGREGLTPDAYAEALTQARQHARDAVRIEPAMYEAWGLLAQIELTRDFKKESEAERLTPERYEAALHQYDEAIRSTPGIRSLHALLGEARQQRYMYGRAFATALAYYRSGTGDVQAERWEWVEKFYKAAETRYRDEALTHYMRGQMADLKGETTQAIQAFQRAEQLAQADPSRYPRLWFDVFAGVLPLEHLALLYRQFNQPGESLRYTEEAMRQYGSEPIRGQFRGEEPPPVSLALNRAELLTALREPQEALDYIATVRRDYGDALKTDEGARLRLAGVEAELYQKQGRAKDVTAPLKDAGATGVRALLMQAQVASMEGDDTTMLARFREALAAPDLTATQAITVVQQLVQLAMKAKKNTEGRQILAEVQRRFEGNEALGRLLKVSDLFLSDLEPEQRDAKLLELIKAEPDPIVQANSYYNYYLGRGEFERAAEYADKVAAARPDDIEVVERQFYLALQLKRFDRAAQCVVALAKYADGRGADQAGGASYRGQLALAQDKAADAVREFRAARNLLPHTSGLQVALGRALLRAGRFSEAVEALLEAVQLNPRDFDANKLLYLAYQSMPLEQRPEDGAVSYLLRARELNPNDPYIKERGEYLDEESNPRAGIENHEKRRRDQAPNVENLIRLGQLYAKVGDAALATERFQEALRIEPANLVLVQTAANFYAKSGRRAEGEQHLRAYLEAQTGRGRAVGFVLLAKFYERLGDAAAAETAFQDAKRGVEQDVSDPDERRRTLADVGFELVDFYRRSAGRERELIDACRWTLDKLRGDDPRDAARRQQARLIIARALLGMSRLGDASAEVQSYRKDYPDDPDGLVALAQIKLAQRQWKEADTALSEVLQKFPNHVWSLLSRARLSIRYGRYAAAKEDLQRARKLVAPPEDAERRTRWRGGPNYVQYLTICSELARLYELTEEATLAESEMQEILKQLGDDPDSLQTAQQVVDRLVRLYSRTQQFDKARQTASELMARYPSNPTWAYRCGSVCTDQAAHLERQAQAAKAQGRSPDERRYNDQARRQYELAASFFDQAWQKAASTEDAAGAMRYFAFKLDAQAAAGQAALAVQAFEQMQSRARQMSAVVRAAVIRAYLGTDRKDEALLQLERGLEASSQEGAGVVGAVVGFSSEHLSGQEVLDALRKVAERAPVETAQGARLRNALAQQLLAAGQAAEALRLTDTVLSKTPAELPERFTTQVLRSQCLDETGDVAGAVQILEKLLEARPGNVTTMNNLAFLLADRAGRPQEALPYAESACEQDSQNPSYLDTLGWVYFKNGKYVEAEVVLKQAVTLSPEFLPALYHLGLLHADRGRSADAKALLRRAQPFATAQKNAEYEKKIAEALDRLP